MPKRYKIELTIQNPSDIKLETAYGRVVGSVEAFIENLPVNAQVIELRFLEVPVGD